MSMENVIKEKTEEVVEKYRKSLEGTGLVFSGLYEDLLRQGISYGITFAAMALASIPNDLTFKSYVEEKKLPSMEEYKNRDDEIVDSIIGEFSAPIFACPKCGGGMCKNHTVVLTTYPVKYQYKCNKCGHIESF